MKRRGTLQRTTALNPGKPLRTRSALRRVGRRADRLRAADRRQERETHAMACACGCNAGAGAISRAHLESRAYEATRNAAWNNLPACLQLATWLDHDSQGVQAKADLLNLARERQERLDAWDVQAILSGWGYYGAKESWRNRDEQPWLSN